ncbi:MAG TPA: Ig-like domain-containing protein [Thermoanaerobaculia bacterium]|nr:Ig-like domain-containing protein [Thermoanaerobaculia bacterium]
MIRRTLWALLVAGLAVACSRKPASIEVSPRPVKIFGLQRTQRLTGRALDKKGRPVEGIALEWVSSKPEVVKVDSSGKLESKAEGKSVVTASFQNLSSQVPVEVLDIKTIEIAPISIRLVGPVGTSTELTTTLKNSRGNSITWPVVWTSSRPKVAKVTSRGEVVSTGPGTTTIVAKVGDLQGASEVNVTIGEVSKVDIHPRTALVRVGDSQHFEVVAYGPDGKPYEGSAAVFKSSDPAVATVDATGTVSGIAAGTTTIRATVAGLSAEATLLVN